MVHTLVKKSKKARGGFTLIELIVVIAILAILAVILVPVLGGFNQRAKVSADNATAKTITTSVTALVADGTISLTDSTANGTFTITPASGTATTFTVGTITNVTVKSGTTLQAELEKLIGTNVKKQQGAAAYTVTIAADNNTVTTAI